MTEKSVRPDLGEAHAAERVASIEALFEGIRETLVTLSENIRQSDGTIPPKFKLKLAEIHSAHLMVLKAEEALDGLRISDDQTNTTDYDAIRADIGCKVDRIRRALAAEGILQRLTNPELLALPYLFDFWAMPHQRPPKGDWRNWVILGGRGAGKTRAGAEWIRSMAEGPTPEAPGKAMHIGLIAETHGEAKEVMVFGESGLMAISPPDRKPTWIAGRRMLIWPNGAVARLYSAHDPESLRGAQFDAIWVDEFAKWRKAQDAWDMIQFGLRLGENPQACLTTTPRNTPALVSLLGQASTVMTHAPTQANRANLADGFIEEVEARYAGSRLGRQELAGELLTDVQGALWQYSQLAKLQAEVLPSLDRIVVAVDPPAKGKSTSDECGIVVCGAVTSGPLKDWHMTVIEDASVSGCSPMEWAKAAVDAYERHDANLLVAEVNQGGDMVGTVVRQVSPLIAYKEVTATKGKALRAEPVATLYEQGRVSHLRGMTALEDQMCQMTIQGFEGKGSPDRVDALVWAATELMVNPSMVGAGPRVRGL